MRIALLTTDNRENFREYEKEVPYFGTAPEALLCGLAEMSGTEVHVISCTQRPMEGPTKLAGNTWFHSLHVPKLGWLRSGYQGCIRAVRRKLREIKPDIVHAQGTERDCALSGAFSGYPNLLTIHGNMRKLAVVHRARPFSFLWLGARLESLVLPRTDGVICITNYTREMVAREARRTWVVPNAVDPKFFALESRPFHEYEILCVGFVCFRKNQNELISALDALAANTKLRLTFLGGLDRHDAYGQKFLDLIAQRSWCEYKGFADRAALRTALSSATAVVLPSLEDNCPMVVLEAMAGGVPVLAAKVGGVPDLIEDGVTGLFCDPASCVSMREGVRKLLEHPVRARELALRARKRALIRFHPEAVARRHLEIYKEVLASDV